MKITPPIFSFLTIILTLFATTAVAQTPTTHPDGLYKIYWQSDNRGYLTYHSADYPDEPQLAGVTLSDYYASLHYALDAEGISLGWYLYTSQKRGKSYLFEATSGKFISFNAGATATGGYVCSLSEEVSAASQLDLYATTTTTGFMFRYVHNGTNYQLCSGCGSTKDNHPVRFVTNSQDDGGVPFVFVEDENLTITDDVKNAAIAKIEAFEDTYYADVVYNYQIDGSTVYSETHYNLAQGENLPAVTTPYGVTIASGAPADGATATSDATYTIECTTALPFEPVSESEVATTTKWYLVTLRGKAVTNNNGTMGYGKTYTENDLFAFTGDPFNGFKIYNMAAGSSKILWNETAQAGTVIALTDVATATTNNTWMLSCSTSGGYTFKKSGTTNGYMHDYNGAVSYWVSSWAANDAGSFVTFTSLEESIESIIEEMEANSAGLNVGYFKNNETVKQQLSSALANQNMDEIKAAYASLERVELVNEKIYKIVSANPRFMEKQGVNKSIYNADGNLRWENEAASTAHYWVAEIVDGVTKFKNYAGEGLYMAHKATTTNEDGTTAESVNDYVVSAATTTETGVTISTNVTLSRITYFAAQYKINVGTMGVVHAESHSSGDGRSGDIVAWDGEADSPSAWRIVEVKSPEQDIAKVSLETALIRANKILSFKGDEYGEYSISDADCTTITDAQAFYDAITDDTTVEAINAQTAKVSSIVEAIEDQYNKPAAGSYLRISYDFGTDGGIKYMQSTEKDNGALLMTDATGAESIYYYDGSTLLSYSKGLYVKETADSRGLQDIGVVGSNVTFSLGASKGRLKIAATRYLHANFSGSVYFIDHCDSDPSNHSSHNLKVEEVTSLPVTIGNSGYATLYAPTALEIPTGVTAYTGSLSGNTLSLTAIDGGVIPANTGVILVADAAGTYNFPVSADAPAAIENNSLGGSACTILATDVSRPYTLQQHDDTVAMYEYIGANLQGFKAYLSLDATAADAAGAIALRFPDATAIQGVNSAASPSALYDLTGRRVDSATATGIYIVDGKKVIIK